VHALSAGIDFSWEKKGRILYACLVLFRGGYLARKVYDYIRGSIYEYTLHFRKLTRKKKKTALSVLDKVLGHEVIPGFSKRDVYAFRLVIPRGSPLISKYTWLEDNIAQLISSIRRYRNYPSQLIIGSDLERGEYSFTRRLERKIGFPIHIYVDDKSPEVCIADLVVNYVRITRKIRVQSHFC